MSAKKEGPRVVRTMLATIGAIDQVRRVEIKMRWSIGVQVSGDEIELVDKDVVDWWDGFDRLNMID